VVLIDIYCRALWENDEKSLAVWAVWAVWAVPPQRVWKLWDDIATFESDCPRHAEIACNVGFEWK
jgi:hypothetical protein